MKKTKILYAEDDSTLAFLTQDNLENFGFEVVHCSDGEVALKTFQKESFDICIFDIIMPKLNGFDLAVSIRKLNNHIPILFLTAKTLKEDKLKGLRLGADDYLVKPFSIEELILKIAIFLKRSQVCTITEDTTIVLGKLIFNYKNLSLKQAEQQVNVTQREADLLFYFIENKNRILKRETILKTLWGDDDYFMGRSLDVFISRLRKILATEPSVIIENIHGIGFRFLIK